MPRNARSRLAGTAFVSKIRLASPLNCDKGYFRGSQLHRSSKCLIIVPGESDRYSVLTASGRQDDKCQGSASVQTWQ